MMTSFYDSSAAVQQHFKHSVRNQIFFSMCWMLCVQSPSFPWQCQIKILTCVPVSICVRNLLNDCWILWLALFEEFIKTKCVALIKCFCSISFCIPHSVLFLMYLEDWYQLRNTAPPSRHRLGLWACFHRSSGSCKLSQCGWRWLAEAGRKVPV